MEQEVNLFERIHQVQLVLLCRHQRKMNQWKDIPVKKVIVIESVAHLAVPKHLDLDVSEKIEPQTEKILFHPVEFFQTTSCLV